MVYNKLGSLSSFPTGTVQWRNINKYLPNLNMDSEQKGYLPGSVPLPREETTLSIFQADMLSLKHEGLKNYRSRKILAQEPFRTSIRRFYLALDAYLDSSNPIQSGREIISLVCFDLNASLFLKRLKIKSFLETSKLTLLELPDWYDNHPWHLIKDIGDVFNFQYVPHIEEDIQDYVYSRQPLKIKKSALEIYKEMIDHILPDEGTFPIIDSREVLLRTTSSSQYIPTSGVKGLTTENWKIKSQFLKFNSEPLKGKRAVIQVAPEGARDTVILPPNQVNTITWIERQVHSIIQEIPGNGMIDNNSEFLDEVHKLRKKYKYFLCRDFEKEGLTKPRILVELLLEAIGKKYPSLAIFCELKNIYSDYSLLVDGKFESFPRGHGLGMANSLTTLMQIVIFHCVLEKLDVIDMNESSECDMLSYNDDFVAGFDSEFFLESYWDEEGLFLKDLGLIRKPQKSFKGDDFVFCEVYSKSLNRKESYLRREILNVFSCTNIVHAKELICSLRNGINCQILDEYMDEIISYWGYEFNPREFNLPSIFGGWHSCNYKGIDYSLDKVENVSFNLRALYEASKIAKVRAPERGSKKDLFINPLKIVLNIQDDDIPKEYKSRFNFGTEREVSKNFNRMSINPGHLAFLYRKCEEERKNTYGLWLNKPQTPLVEIKKIIVEENPTITFISFNEEKVLYTLSDRRRIKERMWFSNNPQLSFIKSLVPEKIQDPMIDNNPLPFLLKGPGFNKIFLSKTDLVRNEYNYANLRKKDDPLPFDIELNEYDFPFNEDIHSRFLDPNIAAELAQLLGYHYICYPLKNSPDPKYLKIRDDLYKIDSLRETRIPKIFDFEDFRFLMELDDVEFEYYIKEIYKFYFEFLERNTKKAEVIEEPLPKKEKVPKVIYDSMSDHYWAWKSDPTNVIPYNFFEEISDTLDLISAMIPSVPGMDIVELMKTQEINPAWFNSYVSVLKYEFTKTGEYYIPNYLLGTNQNDGFESDESFGGGLFDE